jgi:hypothetical protein
VKQFYNSFDRSRIYTLKARRSAPTQKGHSCCRCATRRKSAQGDRHLGASLRGVYCDATAQAERRLSVIRVAVPVVTAAASASHGHASVNVLTGSVWPPTGAQLTSEHVFSK